MIYCLICKEDVSKDGYNPDYAGTAIHHNYQDSYCGPVIECNSAPDEPTRRRLLRNYRARQRYELKRRYAYLHTEEK